MSEPVTADTSSEEFLHRVGYVVYLHAIWLSSSKLNDNNALASLTGVLARLAWAMHGDCVDGKRSRIWGCIPPGAGYTHPPGVWFPDGLPAVRPHGSSVKDYFSDGIPSRKMVDFYYYDNEQFVQPDTENYRLGVVSPLVCSAVLAANRGQARPHRRSIIPPWPLQDLLLALDAREATTDSPVGAGLFDVIRILGARDMSWYERPANLLGG